MKKIEKYEMVGENWFPTKRSVAKIRGDIKEVDDYNYDGTKFEIGDGWVYECVERHGGGEGDGEEHWIVFSISKGDVKKHFQIDGYYQSYHGAELDGDLYEVVEKEVVVKVWEKP